MQRQFHAPVPNRLWVSDFTYVSTWQGFVSVGFIIDVFARVIVGWGVSSTAHTDFVICRILFDIQNGFADIFCLKGNMSIAADQRLDNTPVNDSGQH
ncbi:DDE-type integrase/transposase/recombinase [Acetobacter persici]|uniref:DDE-type integrase/transposase/recombinase n=1 Tax=Acetobacter persici TaxID=1076596 RepID=UPI0039E8B5CA